MELDDIFSFIIYGTSAIINSAEQIDDLRSILEENYAKHEPLLDDSDPPEHIIKEIIQDEALCNSFDIDIITKALEAGFYPMATKKKIFSTDELNFPNIDELYRYLLIVKYHSKKLIIPFDNLHITKKLKSWLNGKFSDYTITFNKNFDLCMEKLLEAYPETWLYPPLVQKFKYLNKNPTDKISVDSVEIWHNNELVAGEIGFITHNAYASLSGFHCENDIGTVQMCILGLYLKYNNFAYWDLGMELEYKYRYGAISCTRNQQEELLKTLTQDKLAFTDKEIPLKDFLRYI